jgi:hypothetical protein
MPSPDELADALFDQPYPQEFRGVGRFIPGKGQRRVVRIKLMKKELRTLARDAAKQALLDAAEAFIHLESFDPDAEDPVGFLHARAEQIGTRDGD